MMKRYSYRVSLLLVTKPDGINISLSDTNDSATLVLTDDPDDANIIATFTEITAISEEGQISAVVRIAISSLFTMDAVPHYFIQ